MDSAVPNSPRRWVIVELSTVGERDFDVRTVSSSVHRILGRSDLEVFVPAISQDVRNDSQTLFFMDGYVFIEFKEDVPYLRLRDTSLFKEVLCNSKPGEAPKFSLLEDRELDPMRQGMEDLKTGDFKVGDPVRVVIGTYKNLRGEISLVYEGGENVQVAVSHLRSKRGLLVDFPATYLERIE